jgi:ABC-type transport system substrate-binding protein
VTLLAVIVSLSVGVASGQGQSPVRGGTLRIGWIPNAKTLDPHLSSQFSDRYILYMAFNTLVALDRSFNVIPELARS